MKRKKRNKNTVANQTISVLCYFDGDAVHTGCIQHSLCTYPWVNGKNFIRIFYFNINFKPYIFKA
jgi:hypothetical protein